MTSVKAMLTAFAAIAVISVFAHFALQEIGYSSQDRYSSPSVRLD